jgi:hypothetical protein
VVLISGAAWFYMAASYVCSYPNSYLSRCAEVAYRMGGEFNPVYRIGHALAVRVRDGADQVLQDHGYVRVGNAGSGCCRSCEPCVPSLETIAASTPAGVFDEMRVEFTTSPVEAVEKGASEECTSGVITVGAFAPPADDDADSAPKTMPLLPPDGQADEAPATMPYEEDDDAEVIEETKPAANPASKESGDEPKTMKPEEESEATPDGDSPDAGNSMNQMPASHYSSHPSCSSCPGTVTCPYTGKTYPANPDDDPKPVVPTILKKKKKKDDAGNVVPSKMSKLIDKEKGTEDVPVHPEVDTMEYRKSDGQKGEFDPQPE